MCTRPLLSVAGTLCTRCTPLSNFSCPYTALPAMLALASLKPPVSLSACSSTCIGASINQLRYLNMLHTTAKQALIHCAGACVDSMNAD